MREFALGDLHGDVKALEKVLLKSQFDFSSDRLIFLGDLADGKPYFEQCLDIFSEVDSFIPILGNHDYQLRKYINSGKISEKWQKIGADLTLPHLTAKVIKKLKKYFNSTRYFYISGDSFFCHGGVNHKKPICKQKKRYMCKNRKMYKVAKVYHQKGIKFKLHDFPNINRFFIGHNTTERPYPEQLSNLINIDTGCNSGGKLTLINTNTLEYYQH